MFKENPLSKKLTSIFFLLFLFFCFFPYLRILPLPLDSQPNALILAVCIFVISFHNKVAKEIKYLLFVLFSAIICMVCSWEGVLGLRILTNYVSLFFITYATYVALRYLNGLPYSFFCNVVYWWFLVGFIQLTIYPSFLDFLLLRSDNELMLARGRGVTSLAVEPTFYGMICLLLMIINHLNFYEQKRYKWILFLLLVQFIVFSRSTTCFFVLGISCTLYILYWVLKGRNCFWWLIGICIGSFVVYKGALYVTSHTDIRFARALHHLLQEPSSFLLMDYSVNNRFMHAFFPLKGFIDNIGFPHGLGNFNDYLMKMSEDAYWGRLLPYDVSGEKKTATSIGGPLFELGIFALPIYYVIITCFRQISKYRIASDFCFFILFGLMLNTLNFNNAILGFFMGNLVYLKYYGYKSISNCTSLQRGTVSAEVHRKHYQSDLF